MKVGIVCPYDWSVPGGVKSHIIGLTAALRDEGLEVEIMAPASKTEDGMFAVGGSIPIPANGSIARICFSNSARRKLRTRLDRGDIDVLHLHEPAIPSVSMLALGASALPSVATFHASAPSSLGYAVARPFLSRLLQKLDSRVVVSDAARSLIGRYFPGEYQLVPNGIEYSRFAGARPLDVLAPLKPFVLFLGRSEPRKGYPVLLEAMKIVRASLDVRLVVAGPSVPERLPPWAHYIGEVSEEEKPGAYAAADVYCSPSTAGESFGIVLMEAMSSGAPVVASDIDAYRDAAGGAAVLARAGSSADLAEKLIAVLKDEGVAAELKERGRRRAKEFDWASLAGKIIELYEGAVS